MTEYFDVVDIQDNPTNELTTKVESHANYIIHRCVSVYVFDSQSRLYIQEHKSSGLLDHTVGGHVSAGEDYLIAAKRESEEEVGLKDQDIKDVFLGLLSDEIFNPTVQTSRIIHMFGIFESYPDDKWRFEPNDEVERIYPLPLEDIVNNMQQNPTLYTPGFINTMAKYLELKRPDLYFDVERCRNGWGNI